MPKVTYNDPKVSKLYGNQVKTLRLKVTGESVKFVLGDEFPVMYGLHWINKKPFACPRVNQEQECPRCKEGFERLAEFREQKLDKESKEYKELKRKTMNYLPDIKYYYPIFATGGSVARGVYLLEATKITYDRFGNLKNKGKDILNLHWQIDKVNAPVYFQTDDIDEPTEMTVEELEELKIIAKADLESFMNYPSISEYYGDNTLVDERVEDLSDSAIENLGASDKKKEKVTESPL